MMFGILIGISFELQANIEKFIFTSELIPTRQRLESKDLK